MTSSSSISLISKWCVFYITDWESSEVQPMYTLWIATLSSKSDSKSPYCHTCIVWYFWETGVIRYTSLYQHYVPLLMAFFILLTCLHYGYDWLSVWLLRVKGPRLQYEKWTAVCRVEANYNRWMTNFMTNFVSFFWNRTCCKISCQTLLVGFFVVLERKFWNKKQ